MEAVKKPKAGLGRGLGALLGDAPQRRAPEPANRAVADQASAGTPTDAAPASDRPNPLGPQTRLPIAFLEPNPDQPRRAFNEDAIQELAQSIAARGMLQPILVRPRGADRYEIVAGERRWRAAQKAQLHEVPVIIRELTDTETAEIALIENVQRVDLNPIEEAQAYQRLAEQFGRTQEAIAKAVGKSRSHIANIMRLLNLPPRTLDALRAGDLTMGHARALLGAPRPDDLCLVVMKGGLSVRETEKLVQYATRPSGRAANKPNGAPAPSDKVGAGAAAPQTALKKDADTRALENDLAAAVGLEVAIVHEKSGQGMLTIKYQDLDQLDDVCRRLMAAGV